jgi:hypothetical protein
VGAGKQLLWVIEEVFIQHNDTIDNIPAVEQTGGGGCDQQVDNGMGVCFAQGTESRGGKEQIAYASHFDDQDARVLWKG